VRSRKNLRAIADSNRVDVSIVIGVASL